MKTKALFFSENSLEDIIINFDNDYKEEKFTIKLYKEIYGTLVNMFYDTIISIPDVLLIDRTNKEEITIDNISNIVNNFSKIISNLDVNNIFSFDYYSLIYNDRDYTGILYFYYKEVFSSMKHKYKEILDNGKIEDLISIAMDVTVLIENNIISLLDFEDICYKDKIYLYIHNGKKFLAFYLCL